MSRPGGPGRAVGPGGAPLASPAAQEGQVLILIIGYAVLCLLVITVVMAASSVYIGHKKLLSVADGASSAAADSFSVSTAGAPDGQPRTALSDAAVAAAAASYLTRTGAAGRLDSLAVARAAGSADGRTAQVRLTAVVRPPIVNWIVPEGIPITASSDARSTLRR